MESPVKIFCIFPGWSLHSSSLICFLTLDCIFPILKILSEHRVTLGFTFSPTSVIYLSTSSKGHWYHLLCLFFPLSPTLNLPSEMVAGFLLFRRYWDREDKTCYPRTLGEAESVRLGRWVGFRQENKGLIWGPLSGCLELIQELYHFHFLAIWGMVWEMGFR